ncbi:MAG: lectin-like protein [Lachnospiraceae bacterium]
MKCPYCGSELPENATFCDQCQQPVTPNAQYYDPNQQRFDPNAQYYDPNQQGFDPNAQYYDPNQQGFDPNAQYYDPNQQGFDPNAQYYDPNQQGFDPNAQYYGPNQQGFDPNAQYYDQTQQGFDPNAQYYDPNQQRFDPNAQYYDQTQQGFDPNAQYYDQTQQGFDPAYNQARKINVRTGKKKKNNGTTIAIVSAAFLLVLAIGGVAFAASQGYLPFGSGSKDDTEANNLIVSDTMEAKEDLSSSKEATETEPSAPVDERDETSDDKPFETLTIDKLEKEYEENSVNAETKYEKSVISLQGYVQSIEKDDENRYEIILSESNDSYNDYLIICYSNDKESVVSIKEKQYVTATGLVHQEGDEVSFLSGCTFKAAKAPVPPSTDVAKDGHRYKIFVSDVTWQQAFDDCKARGGTLLTIDTETEFQQVTKQIADEGHQDVHFYLGGRRDLNSADYYWVDNKNRFTGISLNPNTKSWSATHWMTGEPSLTSPDGDEMYMNLIFYQNTWVLNDVPADITPFYKGKTGYICEFDS